MSDKHWILCGKPDNWEIALKDEIWGLIPKFRGKWRYLKMGDRLLYYATSPVSGMIGFGQVGAKFRQDRPLWPEEIQQGKVLYPFRFEFESDYVVPPGDWTARRIKFSLPVGSYSAINFLGDQDIIDRFYKAAAKDWNIEHRPPEERHEPVEQERPEKKTPELDHETMKDMVHEIGKLHRYIAEKEYWMNGERLDVVWRRIPKSVPTYVFEVQVGGDVYHALAKLKHAYDLWNSNIFLIVSDERDRVKAHELLAGTFHEIRNIINVVSPNKIERIYSLQIEDSKLRKEVGLF